MIWATSWGAWLCEVVSVCGWEQSATMHGGYPESCDDGWPVACVKAVGESALFAEDLAAEARAEPVGWESWMSRD